MISKKLYIIFLFTGLFQILSLANNADSLKLLLSKHQEKDQASIYNQLADIYKNISIDSSKIYTKKALKLAKLHNNQAEIAKAYYQLGHINKREEKYDDALKFYSSSLQIYIVINDSAGQAKAYNNIGDIYFNNSDYDTAIKKYINAQTLKEAISDHKGNAISNLKIGNVYMQWGKYDDALIYYQKALKIFENINFKYGMASVYNNIGVIYENMKQYEKALENYEKALNTIDQESNLYETSDYLNNIGNVYLNKENYDTALVYYKQSLVYREKTGFKQGIASSYNNIGIVLRLSGKVQEAINYYNKALHINEELNNNYEYALNLIALGKCYSELKEFKLAEKNYFESAEIAKQNSYLRVLSLCYEAMSEHYYFIQNYQQAFYYKDSIMIINDSLLNIEMHMQINELLTKYETEKKENEIKILNKDKQVRDLQLTRNKYLVIALIAVIILTLLIFFLLYRQSRLSSLQKNIELEQKLLRSQMNPHFIFNSLIAIQSFIFKNDTFEAGKYLSGFARLIRLILENSREESISLQREIDTLKYYMDLQKLRFSNSFEYEIKTDVLLNSEIAAIPPMLAQPFIENAIEHGIKNKDVKGFISVNFKRVDSNIIFELTDNGLGIKNSLNQPKKDHKSLATEITKERLLIINRTYKNKIHLKIEDLSETSNKTGTKVTFTIPYKTI